MKLISKITLCLSFILCPFLSQGQVGIGTDAPEGMLDMQFNNSTGFVFPKVALTSTILASPVVNPNGGAIVEGTVVFNTNTTTTGSNDVSPGIYAWNGSQWNPQFLRQDSELFEQTTLGVRTVTGDTSYNTGSSNWAEIPGLGTGTSFTPKYTGTYRIKGNFNFAAGRINLPVSGDIEMATMEGLFRFTFNGTPYLMYTHSYSIYNDGINGGTYYEQFKHDTSMVLYVNLTAGQTYNFKLEIDIFVADHFVDNGNSGDGRGYVGVGGLPCAIEFTFID
ncbi:hypothetical protein [Constantimarinum furrinae]|uniref:Uncharacterized protein n=1 Tax=Constantimarinum furrinae TaxID=2562285 RepID=A0A7G8PUD1_9FLAO|nr:hypothetical protein [Constantimarinum furrinae]QNJ97947.1 hypothetical protein ALE3EI_1385 [Constantimarinum furrinae]